MVDWFYRWHSEPDREDWVAWLEVFSMSGPPVHLLRLEGGAEGGAAVRVELDLRPDSESPDGRRRLAVERPRAPPPEPGAAQAAWEPVELGGLTPESLVHGAFARPRATY